MNVTLTISAQGQVVIPVKVRKAMQLKPGSKLNLSLDTKKLIPTAVLRPEPKSWVKAVAGTGKGIWGKNAEEYIKKERDSWDRT